MTGEQMLCYVAFLRGINVGGNAILPMKELRTICEELGFHQVSTYIQSGNVLLKSTLTEDLVVKKLVTELNDKMGKHISVVVRTADELAMVLTNNPFPQAEPAKVGVMIFALPVQKSFLSAVSSSTGEELRVSEREVYIHYPSGMGSSKLKLPEQAREGTVRNINTIRKIIELCNA